MVGKIKNPFRHLERIGKKQARGRKFFSIYKFLPSIACSLVVSPLAL
jgi:hypothetical protein